MVAGRDLEHVNVGELKQNCDSFGPTAPMWSILSRPEGWDTDALSATGRADIESVIMALSDVEVQPTFGRALDFGYGMGRLSEALAGHFEEVVGVDIAPSMVALANRHNHVSDRCRYLVNDAPDLSYFDDVHFDFVYSNMVMQPRAQPFLTTGAA